MGYAKKSSKQELVELKNFAVHKNTYIRIVCDASQYGLEASLKQISSEGWRHISFSYRFPNAAEKVFFKKLEI